MNIPGVKKIPLTKFEKDSKASTTKLARGATARVAKFSKGKSYR